MDEIDDPDGQLDTAAEPNILPGIRSDRKYNFFDDEENEDNNIITNPV